MVGTAAAGVLGAMVGGSAPAEAASRTGLGALTLVNLSHVNDPATTNVYPGDPAFELELSLIHI